MTMKAAVLTGGGDCPGRNAVIRAVVRTIHNGGGEGSQLKGHGFVVQDEELDNFGHVKLGGIGKTVARIIEENTGIETRDVTLGHLQRGGSPSAYDRVLATRLGIHAARLAIHGEFGKMVALRGLKIVAVPLAEAVGEMRTLSPEFMDEAGEFLK